MSLSKVLREVFELDEGMRPGIYFENLSIDEVINIYGFLSEYSDKPENYSTVWNVKTETDVPINSLPKPELLLANGTIENLVHPLINFDFNEIKVSNVSVYVFPDSFEIFYDVRNIKTDNDKINILELVKLIKSRCGNCHPYFGDEGGTPYEKVYQIELTKYINT